MKMPLIIWFATFGLGVAALAGMGAWLSYEPKTELQKHVPGMSGKPEEAKSADSDAVQIGEHFLRCADIEIDPSSGNWPHYLGPGFDNVYREDLSLSTDWGADGPDIAWSVELGEGYAGPAVKNGRVYLMDYDESQRADTLRCYSLSSGKELWRRWYNVDVKRNHGMSRTVPAVTDDYVVTIGPKCHVMCVDAKSGDLKWGMDLVKDYGSEVPMWYTGQNPFIEDGVAVIAPAGDSLMMGVDCESGQIQWQTPNPGDWSMSHSSIIPMKLQRRRMYVYAADGGVAGVAAEGERKGELLWTTNAWSPDLMIPSPIRLSDSRILLTSGRSAGAVVLEIDKGDQDQFNTKVVEEWGAKNGVSSEQQMPVVYQDDLFTVMAKDAGSLRDQLVRTSVDKLQSRDWKSGKTNRFGLGPYLIADDKLWMLSSDGVLTVIDATADSYTELAQADIFEDAQEAWGPMAVAGNRLLMRDSTSMVCLDLSED